MTPLDTLTAAVTAFRCWADLASALANGYVPTVYATTRRKRLLTRAIEAHGYRVWAGR
jgi:hypothetical protein